MNRLPDNAKPPAKDRASAVGVFDRPHALFFAACMATWIWATSVFRLTELGTMQDPSTQALLLACTGFTFLVVITVCNVNEKSASNLEKARKKPSTYLVLTFVGMAAGLLLGGVDARFLHLFPPIMITALLLASTWLSHDRKLKFGWIVVRIDPMDTSRDFFRYACEKLGQERSLTSREREVLQRLAMGQNRSSISRDLVISEETVKSHTKNIYRKLDVHTRQELIDLVGEKTKKLMDR